MRSATTLLCVLAGTLGMLALPASGARADSSAPLAQLTGFHQIVVDDAAGYVFLSEGVDSPLLIGAGATNATSIVVTDLSGTYVTTLDAGDGVEGLAVSPDGGTLYAALAADDAVGVIDTTSLTQTMEYSLGTAVATPYALAVQSGRLWVSYNGTPAGFPGQGAIGDLDLSAASPTFETQGQMGGWYSAPDIAADPSDTGILAAAQPDNTPMTAATYNVAADPTALLIKTPALADCFEHGVAVYPGGGQFVVCGTSYSTTTMSPQTGGSVQGDLADAVSPDGNLDALASSTAAYTFQAGAAVQVNRFGFPGSETLAPGGLSFGSHDSSKLYAVLKNIAGTAYWLQTFDDPATTRTTLTLSGNSQVYLGAPVSLNGNLQRSTGNPPAGTQITITRTEADSSIPPQVFTAATAADGSFSVTDTPTATGTYTYSASYPGSTNIEPATATFTVAVTLVGATLTLSAPSSTVAGIGYTLAGKLTLDTGNPPAGTLITITRTQAGAVGATVLTTTTAADGSFALPQDLTAADTYTYQASYAGDLLTAAATATATVTVKLNKSTLVMNGPSSRVVPRKSFTLGGILILTAGHPAAGTQVNITRTKAGTPTVHFVAKTDANGNFEYTDTLSQLGTYTYTGSYAGNATTTSSTGKVQVTVRLPLPALSISTSASSIRYGGTVKITAHLGSTYTNRTLSIYAQTAGSDTRTLLKRGRVDAHGNLTVSNMAAHSTLFTVAFSGDAHYSAASAMRTVGVAVKVSMSNGGYFATKVIAGITYRVYHHTGRLTTAVAVTPNKSGQCVNLEVQQYDSQSKQWFANETVGCFHLSKSSTISAYLTLLNAAGAQYRMRADYVRSAADATNINTDGAWFYFQVVQ